MIVDAEAMREEVKTAVGEMLPPKDSCDFFAKDVESFKHTEAEFFRLAFEAESRNICSPASTETNTRVAVSTPASAIATAAATSPAEEADQWIEVPFLATAEEPYAAAEEEYAALDEQHVAPESVYDPYTSEAAFPFESSVWLGHELESNAANQSSVSGASLSTNDVRSLHDIVETKRVVRSSKVSAAYLSKKAEDSQPRRRKQGDEDVPPEKEIPKAGVTLAETLVFGTFLLYMLVASVGMIKFDPSKLIGPAVPAQATTMTSEQMRENNAEQAQQQLDTARDLAKDGNQAEAYKAVDASLKLSPTADGYTQRARMQMSAGYVDSAISDFDRAIEINPNPALIYERGQAHMSAKNWSKAVADFSRVLKSSGQPAFRTYAFRGRAFAEMGKYREAIKDYTKSISIAPKDAELEVTGYKNELKKCLTKIKVRRHR